MELLRRDWLRLALLGTAGAAGAALWSGRRGPGPEPRTSAAYAHAHHGGMPPGANPYSHGVEPPQGLGPHALDEALFPPPPEPAAPGRQRTFELWASEQPIEVARGQTFPAWTYNGHVPGPILRATVGDEMQVRFHNFGMRPHNVHFHGSHDPLQDGWEPVPPGGDEQYHIRAEPFGLHLYHCHGMPVSEHVGHGLYGTFIVDPPAPRPDALEVVLLLSGFDLDGDGKNEVYAWNGVGGFFDLYPIKVPVGRLVRVYFVNLVAPDPVASFHLHAQTFDVYRTGTRLAPDENTDVITLGQAERAILEFTLPRPGRYMFHPHQQHMAELGAMGWFAAI
jgi:nitrite reductase (NO-forming)